MSLVKVADSAGVSIATVSRVINNKPGISSDTRDMVYRTMQVMGYQPKPVASRPGRKVASNSQKSISNVALLSFAKFRSQTNSPVYAEIIHGVEAELAAKGITMIFKHVNEEHDICQWLENREVDGLVLFASSSSYIESINNGNTKLPVVSILGETPTCWCDKINYDRPAVADLAFEYIKSLGCNEFLQIFKSNNHISRLAELSDIYGMKIISLADDQDDVFVINETQNRPDQAILDNLFERFLSKNKLPKAIFLPCDSCAVPVYSILMRRGYVPGVDFLAVSVNNEKSLIDGLMPRPATVDIRSFEMGRMAVQRLLWRTEHPFEPRTTLTIDPMLVIPDGIG